MCRHNKPVAELRAIEPARTEPRPIGPLPGRPTFDVPPSFFEPLSDDELEWWEGGSPADPLRDTGGRRRSRATSRAAEERSTDGRRSAPRRRRS